jgi:Na+/H+ antiporter NhaD/arsenite permease-like protein
MWIVCFVTYFLSAVLDNLTTTIVMVSLMKKLLGNPSDRLFFAAMIVIAANADGAWSVIGGVTSTMLWIGGRITPLPVIKNVFLPSLINLLLPLFVVTYLLKGKTIAPSINRERSDGPSNLLERNLMFYLGAGLLIAVPPFKTITHLPPFMGILFGLGILWAVGEILHRNKEPHERKPLTLAHALKQSIWPRSFFSSGSFWR